MENKVFFDTSWCQDVFTPEDDAENEEEHRLFNSK
jgi:hypothetical protein